MSRKYRKMTTQVSEMRIALIDEYKRRWKGIYSLQHDEGGSSSSTLQHHLAELIGFGYACETAGIAREDLRVAEELARDEWEKS